MAKKQYEELFHFNKKKYLKPMLNNATRWNSTYKMIQRALNVKQELTEFCESQKDQKEI